MKTTSWEQIKAILNGIGTSLKNSIRGLLGEIEKMNAEINKAKTEAKKATAQANEAKTTANTALDSANEKLDKYNPVADGQFSLGRKEGSAANSWSFVAGRDCSAGGIGSQAFGFETIASGDYSCAEGYSTWAKGPHSHAEGFGSQTELPASHAEGQNCRALAVASHAEGIETIAKSKAQHVQGQNNVEDAENLYAHIVGNGTRSEPSNAHTLDWSGNAWFAGNVYVGGTAQGDASKVITEAEAGAVIDTKLAEAMSKGGVTVYQKPTSIPIKSGMQIVAYVGAAASITFGMGTTSYTHEFSTANDAAWMLWVQTGEADGLFIFPAGSRKYLQTGSAVSEASISVTTDKEDLSYVVITIE